MKKTFDWENVQGSPQRVLWLKVNHQKPISVDEFVGAMKALKPYSKSKNWRYVGRKNYQPSRLRKQFFYLKKEFGFFEEHG